MTSNAMYTYEKDSFVSEDEKLSQECYMKFDFFTHSSFSNRMHFRERRSRANDSLDKLMLELAS